jgi:uncharacterized protein (TIGR00106 family)
MKAVAEVQVIPIGSGVSVRREVQRAHGVLQDTGLSAQLHAYGTNVEGELEDILRAVHRVHETLHAEGTVRLATFLKIGTRTDKEPALAGKLF